MLRECHRLVHEVVSSAVPGVDVVWAPYQGPLSYPRVSLQQILGPTSTQVQRRQGQPISTTITLGAAAPGADAGFRVAGQIFEVDHDGDAGTAAASLRALVAARRPDWTVGGAGADVTISDPARLIFGARGLWNCTEVNADDGDSVYYFVRRRELTIQAACFSLESKQWETTGSSAMAIRVADAIHAWDPNPHWVYTASRQVTGAITFPGQQAEPVVQNVVEILAWYTEAASPLTGGIDSATGTVNGAAFTV